MWKALAIIFTAVLQISPAADNNNWSRVAQLTAGTPVEVVYGPMKRAAGTVTEANSASIQIQTNTGALLVQRTDTKRVSITTRSRSRKALIGMAIGAGAGVAAMTIAAKAGDIDFRHSWLAAAGAVIGAGAGAGVGASMGGPATIYRAP